MNELITTQVNSYLHLNTVQFPAHQDNLTSRSLNSKVGFIVKRTMLEEKRRLWKKKCLGNNYFTKVGIKGTMKRFFNKGMEMDRREVYDNRESAGRHSATKNEAFEDS